MSANIEAQIHALRPLGMVCRCGRLDRRCTHIPAQVIIKRDSLWAKWRRRKPLVNKKAEEAANAVAGLAARHSSAHDFAINAIDLVLVRMDELASRESVDRVELQSVSDELRIVRRELAVKIARI